MKKIVILFNIVFLFVSFEVYSQCNKIETIVVCDITTIDSNNSGVPDGIINLYDEYTNKTGESLNQGTWYDPDFNFVLDEDSGNLHLWDLKESTTRDTLVPTQINYYKYELYNDECGPDTPAVTLQLQVGAFSGFAVPVFGIDEINAQVCNVDTLITCLPPEYYDLNQTLLSKPTAHKNGIWSYIGNSANFISIDQNKFLHVKSPYEPGPNLVDQEVFELEYTVPGVTSCDDEMKTRVKVSVVRPINSGYGKIEQICESEIQLGQYDANIDLRDDEFLIGEDIEGVWLHDSDPTGQISTPGDSQINLREVYDDLVQTNPKFGCKQYDYSYFIKNRSTICIDQQSDVSFVFYEELRPFKQKEGIPEFCVDDPVVSQVNLYDYIEFTTENGVLFDYPRSLCTNWKQVSGPMSLDLKSKPTSEICNPDYFSDYTSSGTIQIPSDPSAAGTYVFEYFVSPEYNCLIHEDSFDSDGNLIGTVVSNVERSCGVGVSREHPCKSETALITVIINPIFYAGEDIAIEKCGIEFNDQNGDRKPVDLTTLFENDNGVAVYNGTEGVWRDVTGNQIITNPYVFPVVNGERSFNFEYTTTSPKGCVDQANLSIKVYEYKSPGKGGDINMCDNELPVDLFSLLTLNPSQSGVWVLPDGTRSINHSLIFDPSTTDSGEYIYEVPENVLCGVQQSKLNIIVHKNLSAGTDISTDFCISDQLVDLASLLDSTADTGGTFIDLSNTNKLTGSVFDFALLAPDLYEFEYEIGDGLHCPIDKVKISINIIKKYASGTGGVISLCSGDAPIKLYDQLTGIKDDVGTWAGPKGFTSSTHDAELNPLIGESGEYVYTVPSNNNCAGSQTKLNIIINEGPNAGPDITEDVCKSELSIDLVDLLDNSATSGGTFIDLSNTNQLTGSQLAVSNLSAGNYTFEYVVVSNTACKEDKSIITLTLIDLVAPVVKSQTFCASEGVRLVDVDLDADANTNPSNPIVWYDVTDTNSPLQTTEFLSNAKSYLVAYQDPNGCESQKVMASMLLNPIGHPECPNEITQGISPNGDGINDVFELGQLPYVYRQFEIIIYNRYGAEVYKGNFNTPLFNGESNSSLALGKQLPTGIYFYVFQPNDGVTEPIQGEIFLSR